MVLTYGKKWLTVGLISGRLHIRAHAPLGYRGLPLMTVNSREIEHEASAMLYYYIPPHKSEQLI